MKANLPPTSSAERCNGAAHEFSVPKKWRECREKLLRLRDRLTLDEGRLLHDVREPVSGSEGDAGDGSQECDRDLCATLLSAETNMLWEVEEALRRIASGAYGKCESTGKTIPMNRLRLIPWTRYATNAQQEMEMQDPKIRRQAHGLSGCGKAKL